MKIFQNKRYLWSGMLLCGCITFYAGATDVEFQMTYTLPTCSLTFDDGKTSLEYPLGTLLLGTQKDNYIPFTINVDCPDSRALKTAITADVVSGDSVLQSGKDSVRMKVSNAQEEVVDSNSPELWLLTDAGQRVKLTGLESDAFCTKEATATTPNTCKLKPVVSVPAQSATGDFGVTMRFDVKYPL